MDERFQKALSTLEDGSPLYWTIVGSVSIGILGVLDFLTGVEFSFSPFYLAPILLVTWATNFSLGLWMSLLSVLTLLTVEVASGETYSRAILYFLNASVPAVSYVVLAYLAAELKKSQTKERLAARTDFVTGIPNRRCFHELLEIEVERIRRYPHPFTVVYMDMDNFKVVNDLFGHTMGDEVLRSVASELNQKLRRADVIARLGGDEFGLLLPSTRLADAEIIISRIRRDLTEIMVRKNWPISFSIGIVVCLAPPLSPQSLIDMADELMYEIKNSTKDSFCCATWDGKRFLRSNDN